MTPQQLKDSILQLAVEGKLVPQIESEGNAEDLYNQIQKEKAQLIKEGKIKKEKPLDPITEDEIPFDIPQSWKWVKVGEVLFVKSSKRIFESEYVSEGIPFFRSKEIGDLNRGEEIHTKLFITKEKYESIKESFGAPQKGDVLITSVGTIGNYWVSDGREFYYKDGNITQISKSNYIDSSFITLFIDSPLFTKTALSEVAGTAYNALTIVKLNNLLFPLPPLAEQKRIVDKIEKILPLVDKYGEAYNQLSELEEKFPSDLKKSILQYAMEGKLVPQIESEGTAEDLYQQIQKEKALKIKNGEIKKEKPLAPITEDEIPFDIPQNWKWVRVSELLSVKSGLSYNKDNLEKRSDDMVRVLRGGNISELNYCFKEDDVMISSEFVKRDLFLKQNTIITPSVSSLENIGKMGRIEKDLPNSVVGGFVLMLIPHLSDDCLSKYLLYVMSSKQFKDCCKGIVHKSGQAFYNLSRELFLQLLLPLPPLAEQKRIVDKIEELFSVIDSKKN